MNRVRRTVFAVTAAAFALVALPAATSAHVQNSPTSIAFPDTLVGTPSDPQSETVVVSCTVPDMMGGCTTNDTFTPNPTFTGAHPGDFSQTNNCPAALTNILETSQSCQFFITFKPTSIFQLGGTRTATLILGTNGSGSQPVPVSLSGRGFSINALHRMTGERAAALQKCKKKKAKKARKKCKKKASLLPV